MGTADAKLAGNMYATPAICFCGYRSCTMQGARARTGKVYSRRGPPVLGNFELWTPNLVH